MAFVLPEGLHQDLYPLAWLVGKWGGTGMVEYPGLTRMNFEHEVTFEHDGRPFLYYTSKSWLIGEDQRRTKPAASETGYWRINDKKILEVVLAHNTGIAEGWVGIIPKDAAVQLEWDQGYSAPSAKEVTGGRRLYGLVDGQLFTSYDMQTPHQELHAHTWSSLERQSQ